MTRTTSHPEPTPLPEACAAFRGRLSGYLDGTLDAETRDLADRHIARCDACRKLADETEAAERSLAELVDASATPALPEGFTGSILARTIHEAPVEVAGPTTARPVAWLGWVAAAAAVTFSVMTLNLGQPRPIATPSEPAPQLAAVDARPWHASTILSPGMMPTATVLAASDPAASGSIEDLQVLAAAALLFDRLAYDAAGEVDFVREVAEYDEIVERLGRLADAMPEDHADFAATIHVAADLLTLIVGPKVGPDHAGAGDFAPAIDAMPAGRFVELAGSLIRIESRLSRSA